MKQENTTGPVIVLLDGGPAADNRFIKRWFEKSRFVTCESTDIFEALEEISDFTTARRPDVVLLEVASMPDDFRVVKRLTETLDATGLPIFAFSEDGRKVDDGACFEGNLAQLETRLNLIIPAAGEKIRKSVAA